MRFNENCALFVPDDRLAESSVLGTFNLARASLWTAHLLHKGDEPSLLLSV